MHPGFCYLVERADVQDTFDRLAQSLQSQGLSLAHPTTGKITHLEDPGDSIVTTTSELTQLAKSGAHLAIQFWWDSDTYIACNFKRLGPGLVRHAYSLDGFTLPERNVLVEWATDYFKTAALSRKAHLFVGDPDGVTSKEDWDRIAETASALPTILPARLGIPAGWPVASAFGSGFTRIGDVALFCNDM